MTRSPDSEPFRFLVTMDMRDVERLERAAKRMRMSRARYVMLAIMEALRKEPDACPICGKVESHVH